MLLPIAYYGDSKLRAPCLSVTAVTDEIQALVRHMIYTMDQSNGAGLAAPQVGQLIRLFVLRKYVDDRKGNWSLSDPKVYINPRIVSFSKETVVDSEGCLSIPGIRGQVKRPKDISIEATDLKGQLFTEKIEEYNARVFLHENDHLNGVLFIDRMDRRQRKKIEPQLKQIEQKYKNSHLT